MRIDEICPEWWVRSRNDTRELYTIVCEPSRATQIMLKVPSVFAVAGSFSHIKRARRCESGVQIVLGDSPILTTDQDALLRECLERPERDPIDLVKVEIPIHPPRTAEEARSMSEKFWPTVFRRNRCSWHPTPLRDRERVEANCARLLEDITEFIECPEEPQDGLFDCAPFCRIYKGDTIVAEGRQDRSTLKRDLLQHGAMAAIDQLGERVVALAGGPDRAKFKRGPGSRVTEPSPADSELNYKELQADQYYATNCDAYVLNEPCVMCVMGLLHSRISRLFVVAARPRRAAGSRHVFTTADEETTGDLCVAETQSTSSTASTASSQINDHWESSNGGLGGSGINVLSCESLNHHYPVYVCFRE